MVKQDNKKYKFLLILIVFSAYCFTANAQNPWIIIDAQIDERLNEVFFVDSLKGWIVGDSGVILNTSNGGNNWTTQQWGGTDEIIDVFFLNENTGWALAWKLVNDENNGQYGTSILKTTNGGVNWSSEFYQKEDVFINTIYFYDSSYGWMGGYPGFLVYTTDGGNKWIDAHIDSSFTSGFPPLKFNFFSQTYGFACGGIIDISGVIWNTTNGGANWSSQPVGPEPIQDMYFFDSMNIIGVGGDFEYGSGVVVSNDAGRTWKYTSLEVFGIASAISFRTSTEAWAPLGFAQLLLYTTNSGDNWTNIPSPDSSVIYDLQFTDSTHGYACGEGGRILKYIHPHVGIGNNNSNIPVTHTLHQNYPNPFNPVTVIRYELAENGFVTLKVYDINGREVRSFNGGFKTIGQHGINFNAEGLSTGVYYYKIIISPLKGGDEISETKKMVLLK